MRYLIPFLLIPTLVFAQSKAMINTGFGYIRDSKGNIIGKYSDESLGSSIPLCKNCQYVEVPDKQALDNIAVYKSADLQQLDLNRQAINQIIAKEIANDPILSQKQHDIDLARTAESLP